MFFLLIRSLGSLSQAVSGFLLKRMAIQAGVHEAVTRANASVQRVLAHDGKPWQVAPVVAFEWIRDAALIEVMYKVWTGRSALSLIEQFL